MQELVGLKGRLGRYLATAITVGAPLFFVMSETKDAAGNVIPAWKVFWSLFGASNQLLAALTLVAITVWLYRKYQSRWIWPVTGLPAIWMFVMSNWALLRFIKTGFLTAEKTFKVAKDPVSWVALILLVLAAMILVESGRAFFQKPAPAAA
jgi:carbon starvation protein